jgi:2-desacetyl-2-hydroxyethyl bacteriochlorophyllide A dehydrogenase
MRAAVLERFGAPLVLDAARPEPTPGVGEIVLRTHAAGICRTDLKVIDGVIPTTPTPIIPGHEIAGEIVALGDRVAGLAIGDRVLVSLDVTCGVCAYCIVGDRSHCTALQRLGMELDGGLAEYVRAPAINAIVLPDTVPFSAAAIIPDAIGSPYHAVVKLAQVRAGQTVAVYGLGGLGLSAVQIAALAGARVIAIARTQERRESAISMGADAAIDPNDGPVSEQIRDLTRGLGVDVFVDLVGIEGSSEQAMASCRKGGMVIVLGYNVPRLDVPMMRMVYDEIVVRGSRGSTKEDLLEVVDLVARGRLTPIVGRRVGLSDVNEALAALRDGEVIGRTVIEFL